VPGWVASGAIVGTGAAETSGGTVAAGAAVVAAAVVLGAGDGPSDFCGLQAAAASAPDRKAPNATTDPLPIGGA
jgi:hypothetical protein